MTVATAYRNGTFCPPGFCSGNAAACKEFYTKLFGWEAVDMTMGEGRYTMFKVGGQDVAGMYEMTPTRKDAGVRPHWNTYIAVDDIDDVCRKVEAAGGKVISPPFDADGDRMANLADPYGAKFSVWQAVKPPDQARMNEVGTLCWSEVYTEDPHISGEFYNKVFGWKPEAFQGGPMPYTIFEGANGNTAGAGMAKLCEEMKGLKPSWMCYFMSDDPDAVVAKAKELGGEADGPWEIPTVGHIAMLRDPEGAPFAIIKPQM